jgi:hypothetical protein
MPGTKIVNEDEVKRWFAEGKTYAEMTAIYREAYNIEMTPSAWGNFRRRHGLARRFARNDELIPWKVDKDHEYAYPLTMLRVEARIREGLPVSDASKVRLENFKRMLEEGNLVVQYEAGTPDGFYYVPRTKGDTDLIHRPDRATKVGVRAD